MGRREREAKRLQALGGAEGPVRRALHHPPPAGLQSCVVVPSCAAPASAQSLRCGGAFLEAPRVHAACTR